MTTTLEASAPVLLPPPAPAAAGAPPEEAIPEPVRASEARELPVEAIDPSPLNPRKDWADARLDELAASIARHGILQPLLVRPSVTLDRFELIAGERRLRAARKLGLETVPGVVLAAPDEQALELALVENLQRKDLGPIESAEAMRALLDRFRWTHAQVAERLGLSRPAVTNALRLLDLPDDLKADVTKGRLTAGHARALAGLGDGAVRKRLAEKAITGGLTVRALEDEVRRAKEAPAKPTAGAKGGTARKGRPAFMSQIEDRLRRRLGTKVSIQETGPSRGRIVIDYYGEDDFERLLALFE